MPHIEVTAPGTTAPIDRLSITESWARPTATGIDNVTPSYSVAASGGYCFADEA